MAEGEERFDALRLVPPVSHLEALGVVDLPDLLRPPAGRVVDPFEKMPGYCSGAFVGTSASDFGKDIGSLPEGLTSPNSSPASAGPTCSPPYHASNTPDTSSIHGISTALPVLKHHDRRVVGCGDLADERVPAALQVQVGQVAELAHALVSEDDRHVGGRGIRCHARRVGARG